ncbi:hypothetical protein BT93_F1131 [Corymbia citriodora subsp. variegata]|nr:hypothetical protein BT93_F1131 [Corymbia citriodora subsp. variegata]
MDELETWCRKAKRIKGEYWSIVRSFREGKSFSPQQMERVDDLSKEVEDILAHDSFQRGSTTCAAGYRKSSPLVTSKLIGNESENQIKKICDYLIEDEIFIIGVYGMGGVGKTAILMHVHNRILLENPTFNDVFWVSVPQVFSVYELQDEIANAIGLDNLSKDKDVKRRACILDKHLKKKKSVLILDGLWMHFEVEDLGIPVEKGGFKLVLTTRSLDVCRKMLCQKQMKIERLNEHDAWSLFLEKLHFERKLPSEVENIARSIINKCWGLPLGIIEIATHMRGVEEVHEWKDLLQKLENLSMKLNVFEKLKLSYLNLGNPQVQQCFLHLILCFGKDLFEAYCTEDLIESFIDEGLLGGSATRQELYDRGNTILDIFRKACLWDNQEEEEHVHPLIRDMILQTVTSTTHMVKAYIGLKEIPQEDYWTVHLEKVFLQRNKIEQIPYGISPNCPKLTRLSLSNNVNLEFIHESFFRHLKGLKVLDLSGTGIIELPDPICHLESLEALLLQCCEALCCIPYLGKLGSLRKLDLKGCVGIEEMPEGLEMLVKLTYLNLDGTKIEMLAEGVLGKLVNLQYLAIQGVRAGEEAKLKKVEALYCCLQDVEAFNACVRLLEQNSSQQYHLALNVLAEDDLWPDPRRHIIIDSCGSVAARVDGGISGDSCALLPKNVQVLDVALCDGLTSLCDIGPLEILEVLKIDECDNLEELGPLHFPHLRNLDITRCSRLKHLLEEGQGLPSLLSLHIKGSEVLEGIKIAAPSLYSIFVGECPKMKRAVEWEWLTTRLPNLERITTCFCEKLEEMIGGPYPTGATCLLKSLRIKGCNNVKGVLLSQDMLLHLPLLQEISVEECEGIVAIIGTVPNMMPSSFPDLTRLTLWDLPNLRSVCDGTMRFHSLEYISVRRCPHLKTIPVPLFLHDDGLPSPLPSLRYIVMDNRGESTAQVPKFGTKGHLSAKSYKRYT